MHVSYQSESLLVKLPAQKLFLKGDAVAALRQTTGKNAQGKRQNEYMETVQLTCSDLIICFRQGDFELLLKLLIFCFQRFDTTIFRKNNEITAGIGFANGLNDTFPY